MNLKVYSIVVTYNGMQWIDRCLQSLLNSSVATEIIVVDNDSSDGTDLHVITNYPQVKLISSGRNMGFGSGNNIGLREAVENHADYVFLLNQDAWVEQHTIQNLIAAHGQNQQYGILSPVHMNGTGSDFDDKFYQYLLNANDQKLLKNFLEDKCSSDVILSVPFVNAAAWLISSACIAKTGGFDPLFFHYGEDDNYCNRVWCNNFFIGVLLSERIFHNRNYSSDGIKNTDLKKKVHSELTQFLVYASDMRRSKFRWFMLKRSIRHFLLFLKDLLIFQKHSIFFHYIMSRKILSMIGPVSSSRKIYAENSQKPFL